jgi:hypothetical protein
VQYLSLHLFETSMNKKKVSQNKCLKKNISLSKKKRPWGKDHSQAGIASRRNDQENTPKALPNRASTQVQPAAPYITHKGAAGGSNCFLTQACLNSHPQGVQPRNYCATIRPQACSLSLSKQ